MKILVADNDFTVLNAVSHRLKAEGHEVYVTELEEHALQIVKEKRPDLIISDVMMPELCGTSLTGLFKRFYRKVPVIVTAPEQMKHKIFTSGTLEEEDVILKPINLNELCIWIATVVGSRRAANS
ncbi:MAG: response regulator transcription factor [Bacteroidia bacterium]